MQDGQQPNEPGWVFRPGDSIPPSLVTPSEGVAPPSAPAPPMQPAAPTPVVSADFEEAAPVPVSAVPSPPPLASIDQSPQPAEYSSRQDNDTRAQWSASEYIAMPKGLNWYILLAIVFFLIAGVVYVITRDTVATTVTAMLGVMVGILAARQPKTLQYRIDSRGIYIGERFYPYSVFKSFSLARDHAMGYISLMPLKRFLPPISIHYEPQDEDQIAETLSDYLPYEEHKIDLVESFSRRIRF